MLSGYGFLGVLEVAEGMAIPEYVEILRQGAEAWSRWRMDSPRETPDLSQTLLRGANLGGFDLSGTNLKGAYLKDADLNQAFLVQSNLTGACLIGTNLKSADLSGAMLIGADLTRTDLSGANLREAVLSQANLKHANLEEIRHWNEVGDVTLANLYRVVGSPDGFRDWATGRGAVFLSTPKWKALKGRVHNGNGAAHPLTGGND